MAGLRQANVLTIYEAGSHGDRVYVAMERVAGGTLRQALADRPTGDWQAGVRSYAEAGRGLAAAHAAELVHRDLQPANVLVDGDRVLCADFGLVGAQPRTKIEPAGDDRLDVQLTRNDSVLGTPAYMAPELYAGAVAERAPASSRFACRCTRASTASCRSSA